MSFQKGLAALVLTGTLGLAGCVAPGEREPLEQAPTVTPQSQTGLNLEALPPPTRKIDIAIYNFPDLTGQNKPNDHIAEYSRAVTQGGTAFVIDALRNAGGGTWFSVVERNGLQNLLQERQLIRATRQEFEGENSKPLPPIRFAGLIMEGGILAYDANTITGGIGARYLGIGGDVKYRRDVVTVGMRLVSVQSGEVLNSVTTTKTIYSFGASGGTFKYVAIDRLLEFEAGFTRNEPTQMAVREAIELAVYSTIMEGVRKGLWKFRDPVAQTKLVNDYLLRDKGVAEEEVADKMIAAEGIARAQALAAATQMASAPSAPDPARVAAKAQQPESAPETVVRIAPAVPSAPVERPPPAEKAAHMPPPVPQQPAPEPRVPSNIQAWLAAPPPDAARFSGKDGSRLEARPGHTATEHASTGSTACLKAGCAQ